MLLKHGLADSLKMSFVLDPCLNQIQYLHVFPWTDFCFYATDTEVVEKQAKEETVVENATPDYAAGLVSTQVKNRATEEKILQHNEITEMRKPRCMLF